jgi:hypothetical protein
MTPFEKYNLLINSIFAFLTLIVVIIAIWGERIRQLWTKPILKIYLYEPSLTKTNAGIKGWYYLIRVSNDRPSSPAKNVRVILTKVFKQGPDGSWQEQRFSGPTQVMWRWPQISPLYATVGPDELSTFGYLLENSHSFELNLYWYPNNLKRKILQNEPTRLVFKAVSDTAESKSITLEVAWDGIWLDGSAEMKNHLIIKEVFA